MKNFNGIVLNDYPHPGPLPSDGRGRIVVRFLEISCVGVCRTIIREPEIGNRCSLSHRMGEGQGEGGLYN
jgi:hypothetical protein